jgi:peptidyl-prolyl cis-trans isomerase B (cyclophilin B)
LKKKIILIILTIGLIVMAAGCEGASNTNSNAPEKNPQLTFELMDGQKFVVELLPEYAPNTVNNFISIAKSGFYEGTVFHRILPDLIIQGGGVKEVPDEPGVYYEDRVDYTIKGEFANNGFTQNTLKHERGVISTARTMEPDSASNQFFILLGTYPDWDGEYAAFGRVISGMETVEFIHQNYLENGFEGELPKIKSVTAETFGHEYPEPVKVQ